MAQDSDTSYAGNLLRAAGQGVTFGFGDEIEALVRAAMSDRSYQEEVKDIREDIEQFREDSPVAAYGSEIVGAIPTGVGLGIGLLRAGVRGAGKLGAIEGGIYGIGEGEGVEGTVKSAAIGTGIGAVGGAVGEKVVEAATPAAKRIYGRVREALSREPESSVTGGIGDILRTNETFSEGTRLNYQRFRFGALNEDELVAEHGLLAQDVQLLKDRQQFQRRRDAGEEGAAEALEANDMLVADMFIRRFPNMTQLQAGVGAGDALIADDPGTILNLVNSDTQGFIARLETDRFVLRNEMAGRRGTELEQLTPEQAALFNNQFDQNTLENVVDGAEEAAFAQQLQDVDFTDAFADRPAPQSRVDLDDTAVPPLGVSLMQSTSLTPLDDGINPPMQLGIGALDESPGLHATNVLSIGSMPDQYGGAVMHYSPIITSFEKLKLNPKGVKFTAGGELSAADYMAHFRNDGKTPGGSGELDGSELQRILDADPDAMYTLDEMRTLIASRLPQTVERLFLEGGTGPLAPDVTEAPFSSGIPYVGAQYRSEDKMLGQERGVIVYSNSAPTIDIPGYGRTKPKGIGGHDYYSKYPGYYGHTRFQIMTGADGKRYLWINEIQSNAVSNLVSGTRLADNTYVRSLSDRLTAFNLNRTPANDQSIRIPYTKEVHDKMVRLEAMKPDVLKQNDTLTKQLKEYNAAADKIKNSKEYRSTPNFILDSDTQETAVIKYSDSLRAALNNDDDFSAGVFNDLRDALDGGDTDPYAMERVESRIYDFFEAQSGEGISVEQAKNLRDILEEGYRNMDYPETPDIRNFITSVDNEVETVGSQYLDLAKQRLIYDSDEFLEAVTNLDSELLTKLAGKRNSKTENEAQDALKAALGEDYIQNKFGPAFEKLKNDVLDLSGYYADANRSAFIPREIDIEGDFDDALGLLIRHVPTVFANKERNDLLAKAAAVTEEADKILPDVIKAKDEYTEAIKSQADADDLQILQDVAKKTITTNGTEGFQTPTPYSNRNNADQRFYEFATRSAIQQAEKLGLDGVVFADARYLATAPGRDEDAITGFSEVGNVSAAFSRNYGSAIDKALKGFSDAGGTVQLRNHSEDPNPIFFGNKSEFTVRAIDPNDADVVSQLTPLQDKVDQAEAPVKALRKEVKDLKNRLDELKNDPNEYRLTPSGNRRRVIRTGTDGDMIESESQKVIAALNSKKADLRNAELQLDIEKGVLTAKKRELAVDYKTPLRVVNLRDRANKETAQRPIRRAAGGMIRSGIGSMAREVM